MSESITNSEDIIDSREVIERLAELSGMWADWQNNKADDSLILDDDEIAELKALTVLSEECSDYADDWAYGAALIRDSYFMEYAQELAEDIGAIDSEASWPNNCIDWERAAQELRMDYTSVDFDGVTYWVR